MSVLSVLCTKYLVRMLYKLILILIYKVLRQNMDDRRPSNGGLLEQERDRRGADLACGATVCHWLTATPLTSHPETVTTDTPTGNSTSQACQASSLCCNLIPQFQAPSCIEEVSKAHILQMVSFGLKEDLDPPIAIWLGSWRPLGLCGDAVSVGSSVGNQWTNSSHMQDAGTSSESIYNLFSGKVRRRTFWQSVPVITVKKLFCSKSHGLSRAKPSWSRPSLRALAWPRNCENLSPLKPGPSQAGTILLCLVYRATKPLVSVIYSYWIWIMIRSISCWHPAMYMWTRIIAQEMWMSR